MEVVSFKVNAILIELKSTTTEFKLKDCEF